MQLCRRCIYPSTRPDTHFVDGLCSACRSFDERQKTNWAEREEALRSLIRKARHETNAAFDCVVPVSGGKDSTYQVLRLLQLGARVLAVHAFTDMPSEIGTRNLNNIRKMTDVVSYGVPSDVRKKLVRLGLFHVGDMSWPEHSSIWSIPTRVAGDRGIPLIVWGEQPQREYATPEGVVPATRLDAKWVAEFGGMLGMRIEDAVGFEGLTAEDVAPLIFPEPDDDPLEAIWLGDYEPWDGWRNGFIAQQHGFEVLPFPVETSLANYENLDNHVTVLRDWLRFLKFGYSRATDIACNHIRRGRLTREDGAYLACKAERYPRSSLGMPVSDVLTYFEISEDAWLEQCDKWTNPEIFVFESGKPMKLGDGTPCRLQSVSSLLS